MFSLDNEKFLCAEEENKIIGYAYDEDYSEYQYMMLGKFGRTFEVRQKNSTSIIVVHFTYLKNKNINTDFRTLYENLTFISLNITPSMALFIM